MAMSAFDDKAHVPTDRDVEAVLGRAWTHWQALRETLAETYEPLDETWGFTGAKYGWSLRLKQKERSVVYLMPYQKYFLASTAYGAMAVKASALSDLLPETRKVIATAPKFAEGRAVRLEVRTKKDCAEVEKMLAIKMSI